MGQHKCIIRFTKCKRKRHKTLPCQWLMRQCMEINGKELKSKEENRNVQGIPHTESKSSGPSHLPEHQSNWLARVQRRFFTVFFFLLLVWYLPQGSCDPTAWHRLTTLCSWAPWYKTLGNLSWVQPHFMAISGWGVGGTLTDARILPKQTFCWWKFSKVESKWWKPKIWLHPLEFQSKTLLLEETNGLNQPLS